MPVLASLAHDVLITVGIYSLTGREVSTSTVAAFLTVLGYSIYDTIIIFDRVRENVPLMRRALVRARSRTSRSGRRSGARWRRRSSPCSRSRSLYFFGGDTLKDFAFALLVGIGSGAYSSIFIAAPLLTMLQGARAGVRDDRRPGRRSGSDKGPEPDGGTPARRPPRPPIGGPAVDTGTMALEAATQAPPRSPRRA